jgi:hypothetical protein
MASSLTIRPALPDDAAAVADLAALDASRPLTGAVLVAEADGVAVAAIELVGGRLVADPFRSTAAAQTLLRARAAQLRPRRARGARRRMPVPLRA